MTKLFVEIGLLALILSLETLFPLFDNRGGRARHVIENLFIGTLNGIFMAFFFSSLFVGLTHWGKTHDAGLLRMLNLSPWAAGLLGFVLFDLWMYLWHVANHRMPFLWRFHRVHHTDQAMDATTALRFHAGEIAISAVLRLGVIALLGLDFAWLLAYELVLQPIVLFHHSNIALPDLWDQRLRSLIVSPNMHRVHHSQKIEETNSNYASIFSFWDRLGKSYGERSDVKGIGFGLAEFQGARWQGIRGMLVLPFVSVRHGGIS